MVPECSLEYADLVGGKESQKLVDTMLAMDLVYASEGGEWVAVVTSDHDFAPPILQALYGGGRIVHVYPLGVPAADPYLPPPGTGDRYIQAPL